MLRTRYSTTRLTEEERRDRDHHRYVKRQIESHFWSRLIAILEERGNMVLLVQAVTDEREDAGDEVGEEGQTLLTEVEVVDLAEDEGEGFEEEL
jgi:hypothetical protein